MGIRSLARTLQRVTSPFTEFGLLPGAVYVVDRAFVRLSPRLRLYFYDLMVQPIPEAPLLPARFARQLEIREIKRGDPEMHLMPVRPEVLQARFEQNAICLGAFHKGQFIGYMWFCFRAYEEDEVRCTFVVTPAECAVFDFDLYLFPEHRLGLGFIGLWHGANEFLRSRGVRCSFSRLTRFNTASRRAHDHLGWKRVCTVVVVQAWSLELMMASQPPYVHLSAGRSRARLTLRPHVLAT